MANKAKKANWQNHIRQKQFLENGVVMLPKKPIREKSRKKQLKAALMKIKANMTPPRKKRRRKNVEPA